MSVPLKGLYFQGFVYKFFLKMASFKCVYFWYIREDAEDVIEIMRETMVDIFTDGLGGGLDFSRSVNGSGMSARYLF